MEAIFKDVAGLVALAIEAIVVLIIVFGAVQAVFRTLSEAARPDRLQQARRATWLGFAGQILMALEFALAADIVRTAIAPTWDDIGKLAAIAAIRTALNYFLSRDIAEFRAADTATER